VQKRDEVRESRFRRARAGQTTLRNGAVSTMATETWNSQSDGVVGNDCSIGAVVDEIERKEIGAVEF